MINTAPIRAEARATAGDMVMLSKQQLDQLLDEVDDGQRAKRKLQSLSAIAGTVTGIDRVSGPA